MQDCLTLRTLKYGGPQGKFLQTWRSLRVKFESKLASSGPFLVHISRKYTLLDEHSIQ